MRDGALVIVKVFLQWGEPSVLLLTSLGLINRRPIGSLWLVHSNAAIGCPFPTRLTLFHSPALHCTSRFEKLSLYAAIRLSGRRSVSSVLTIAP